VPPQLRHLHRYRMHISHPIRPLVVKIQKINMVEFGRHVSMTTDGWRWTNFDMWTNWNGTGHAWYMCLVWFDARIALRAWTWMVCHGTLRGLNLNGLSLVKPVTDQLCLKMRIAEPRHVPSPVRATSTFFFILSLLSLKTCNYDLRGRKSSLRLTKFLVNSIIFMASNQFIVKTHFIVNLMIFIWYHKYCYFFIYNWSN
jgi:hypothetical protein